MNQLLRRDLLSYKFRERFETWIIPMINPDGVVCGNYRSNLQGKDMNRNYYADDDKEARERVHEVELLRSLLKTLK
jgi:cytosolic carboxypeptidase protein 2/3